VGLLSALNMSVFVCWPNTSGGVAQMVERSLSMREVPGSIPGASNWLYCILTVPEVTASTVGEHWRDTSFAAPQPSLSPQFTPSQEGAAVGDGSRPPIGNSIVGSVVECSPATRAARVRFPDDAVAKHLLSP
jgi:hypothetical protein